MTTLREQVENRKCRYHLGKCRVLVIDTKRSNMVQREDGRYVDISDPTVYLQRQGDGKMGPWSHELDPLNEQHADYIAVIDDWIQRHPREAKTKEVFKIGSGRPPEQIRNWDNMDPEEIRTVLDATKGDLDWAMDYELKRPDELGGEREEVVEVLEDLYVNGFESEIESSEEAPAL